MNRKKALITVAVIEAIINLAVIVLFVLGKMSLMQFIILFAAVTLLTMGVLLVIIKKTE